MDQIGKCEHIGCSNISLFACKKCKREYCIEHAKEHNGNVGQSVAALKKDFFELEDVKQYL